MHNLDTLIRRLRTAAARGYGVGAAAKYAKMLGGDGSEKSARGLLALAKKAEAKAKGSSDANPNEPEVIAPLEEEIEIEIDMGPIVEADEIDEDPDDDEGAEPDLLEKAGLTSRKELRGMTREDLYDVAQKVDLTGRSDLNKRDLLKALRGLLA